LNAGVVAAVVAAAGRLAAVVVAVTHQV